MRACCALIVSCYLLFSAMTLSAAAVHMPRLLLQAKQPAAEPLNAPCARPGYVFIQCQEPERWDTSNLDREITMQYGASIDELQQLCNGMVTGTCIAFTTDGRLFSADSSTGKAGPLLDIKGCNASVPNQLRDLKGESNKTTSVELCMGTYVFDGTVVRKEYQVGPRNASSSRSHVPVASQVAAGLSASYVRGQQSTGGRVGKAQCSLC